MATVTGLTAERMEEIEDASVVSGTVVDNDLILTTHGGDDINAGSVKVSTILSDYQTGDRTLVLTDYGKSVDMDNTADASVKVPANSVVAYPVGAVIEILRMNTGEVSVIPVPSSGVVIHSVSGFTRITSRWQTASLRQLAIDDWVLIGALKT